MILMSAVGSTRSATTQSTIEHLVLHDRVPDLEPLGLEKGEHHAAPDENLVHPPEEVVYRPYLVRDLRASHDGRHRLDGLGENAVEIVDLLLHEKTGDGDGNVPGDGVEGGVSAMGGAESVADVNLTAVGEAAGELIVIGLLPFMEAEILQEKDLARSQLVDLPLHLLPDTVVDEKDPGVQKPLQPFSHHRQRVPGIRLPVGTAEVGGDDDAALLVDEVVYRRQRRPDADVIGNVPLLVEGYIEIDPHEDTLPRKRNVFDGQLVNCYLPPRSRLAMKYSRSRRRQQ